MVAKLGEGRLVVFHLCQLFPLFVVSEVVEGEEANADACGEVLIQFTECFQCPGTLLLCFGHWDQLDDVVAPAEVVVGRCFVELIVCTENGLEHAFGGRRDVGDRDSAALFGFEFAAEIAVAAYDVFVKVVRHLEVCWEETKELVVDGVREVVVSSFVFDRTGRDANDDTVCLTCSVVAGRGVNVDVLVPRVYRGVRLLRSVTENLLQAVVVVAEIIPVVFVPHLRDKPDALLLEYLGVEGVIDGGGAEREVEGRRVSAPSSFVVVVSVVAVSRWLFCFQELDPVHFQHHWFFPASVVLQHSVDVLLQGGFRDPWESRLFLVVRFVAHHQCKVDGCRWVRCFGVFRCCPVWVDGGLRGCLHGVVGAVLVFRRVLGVVLFAIVGRGIVLVVAVHVVVVVGLRGLVAVSAFQVRESVVLPIGRGGGVVGVTQHCLLCVFGRMVEDPGRCGGGGQCAGASAGQGRWG